MYSKSIYNYQIETIYPKSNNHKIIWNKKNKINICELNKNCIEKTFDLNQYQKYKSLCNNSSISINNYLLYSAIIFFIILLFFLNIKHFFSYDN